MDTGPTRCPRCRTVVSGDYKFCPACAFRLQEIAAEPQSPPTRRAIWKLLLFSVVGGIVALGCAALGFMLFAPTFFERTKPPPPTPPPAHADELGPAKSVDDIPEDLVDLDTMGFAGFYPVSALRLDDATRDRVVTALGHADVIRALVPRSPRFLRYEVTCGQYAEFLEDILARPDRIPDFWRRVAKVQAVEDVDVMKHVPRHWITVDDAGERSWHLDERARNLPVTSVSFVDAQGFAEWASKRLDIPLRLPLVMEWMRAARGGREDYVWPWGKRPLIYACNNLGFGSGDGRPYPVQFVYSEGNGGATIEGLFAMAGNVAEWTFDHDVEVQFPNTLGDPYLTWKAKPREVETLYYVCGGSFRSGIDDCQAESRERALQTSVRDDVGFRLVAESR